MATNMVQLKAVCPMCGKEEVFTVSREQYEEYQAGHKHVQDIFPELPAAKREMLITGMCESCWDKLFKEED